MKMTTTPRPRLAWHHERSLCWVSDEVSGDGRLGHLLLLSQGHYQKAEMEVEQPRLYLVPVWDAGRHRWWLDLLHEILELLCHLARTLFSVPSACSSLCPGSSMNHCPKELDHWEVSDSSKQRRQKSSGGEIRGRKGASWG